MKDFRCSICDSVGKWRNVDEFRYKKSGMNVCLTCGFVTYPEIQQKSNDLTEYYREEYREAPSVNNIFSGERKLHYHSIFLQGVFKKWKDQKKDNPQVLEIGSAFGMFLQWFKSAVPGAVLHGTELTLTFRRVAYQMYGILLSEWPDFSKKYDLICSYKVAEHIPNIDVELLKYKEALVPDGMLYISVPTWFGTMNNFGLSGFSLEYYYHKNHINVWSKNLFETLLKKVGLRVVVHNDTYYDDTYLCVRDDSLMKEKPVYDDIELRLSQLDRINQAARHFDVGEFKEAIKVWPDFPDAHVNCYEQTRGQKAKEGLGKTEQLSHAIGMHLDPALKACPKSSFLRNFVADLYMRYEQYPEALKALEASLELKPNDPQALVALHHCYRQMWAKAGTEADKNKFLKEAIEVLKYLKQTSMQMSFDAMTWLMQDYSQIELPVENDERNNKAAQSNSK